MQPKPGEVWKCKIFHRTYWRSATIKLVGTNPYRPGFGWLFHTRVGGFYWSEGTECRLNAHIKFLRRL